MPEKCKHYTVPLLHQHWTNTACRYWASTGAIHCASTGPMLDHYYPSTGPIQHAGTGPALGQYIAQVLAQCWTITTPALGQYSMPVLGQYNAPALAQCWTSTGAVPHASIGPIHSCCAVYVLGQCHLYRPASIGSVLAQYCHVSWEGVFLIK